MFHLNNDPKRRCRNDATSFWPVAASTSSAQADAAAFRSVDTAGFAAAIEKSPQSSAFRKQFAR
jgi:hypothetical protein